MSELTAKGYLNVTVANIGGRRKRAPAQEALLLECLKFRVGLVLFQEFDESVLRLPVQCFWNKTAWLATALNHKLGTISQVAVHEVKGKGPKKSPYCQTDILVSDVELHPPRAGLQCLRVVNVHFHHHMASMTLKGNYESRQRVYDIIADAAKEAPLGTPTLVGGDFNSRWWETSTVLRERQLEVEPLVLPEGGKDGVQPMEDENGWWPDCIALFWVGPRSLLPPKRTPNHYKAFDPANLLIGHGAHRPVACFLAGRQPLRSEAGQRRQKMRRLTRLRSPS